MASTASRFALLQDDVTGPYDVKKKKAPKPVPSVNGGANKAKKDVKPGKNHMSTVVPKVLNKALTVKTPMNNQDKMIRKPDGKKSEETSGNVEAQQWEDWKTRDQQFVDNTYHDHLVKAMTNSKLEFDQQTLKIGKAKQVRRGSAGPSSEMSLGEMNALLHKGVPVEKVSSFFVNNGSKMNVMNKVHEDVISTIMKERKRDEHAAEVLRLAARYEAGGTNKNQAQVAEGGVAHLQQIIKDQSQALVDLEIKYKNAVDHVQNLCTILSETQAKDKAILINERNKALEANADLAREIELVTTQLEKERTVARTYHLENKRLLQATRHRSVSVSESNN